MCNRKLKVRIYVCVCVLPSISVRRDHVFPFTVSSIENTSNLVLDNAVLLCLPSLVIIFRPWSSGLVIINNCYFPHYFSHEFSFVMMNWTCWYGPSLYQIYIRIYDILWGYFRVYNWLFLPCLMRWINHPHPLYRFAAYKHSFRWQLIGVLGTKENFLPSFSLLIHMFNRYFSIQCIRVPYIF